MARVCFKTSFGAGSFLLAVLSIGCDKITVTHTKVDEGYFPSGEPSQYSTSEAALTVIAEGPQPVVHFTLAATTKTSTLAGIHYWVERQDDSIGAWHLVDNIVRYAVGKKDASGHMIMPNSVNFTVPGPGDPVIVKQGDPSMVLKLEGTSFAGPMVRLTAQAWLMNNKTMTVQGVYYAFPANFPIPH